MHVCLLFLESTSDILFILVAALILFGPRRLPQLSKQIGKSLAEFKRASEEFKRTWEQEVEMESTRKSAYVDQAMLPEENSIAGTVERTRALPEATHTESAPPVVPEVVAAETVTSGTGPVAPAVASAPEPSRKKDWL